MEAPKVKVVNAASNATGTPVLGVKHDNPDACISCNICLTACPVAKASRLYRGPKLNGPALTRLRLLVNDSDPMIKYCSNCKNCDRVCPAGTSISAFNMKARAEYFQGTRRQTGLNDTAGHDSKTGHKHDLADLILSNNETLGKLMTAIPGISAVGANLGMKIAGITGILTKAGIATDAPLPSYAPIPFLLRFKAYKQPSSTTKVLFFPGCYVNYNAPEVGMDMVKVFNRNNIEVIVDPRLTCCGSPILSTGYLDKVEQHAKKNCAILKEYADQGIDIVSTCTTCSLFLKQEYAELFNFKEISSFQHKVYDALEYLKLRDERGLMVKSFGALPQKFAYHTPCHLKVQGIGRPGFELLKYIPGLELEDLQAGCCGLSGVYGYKKDTAPIGKIIGETLRNKLTQSDADLGVCECNICRLQMQNGTNKKAVHPLTLMRQSYDKLAGR